MIKESTNLDTTMSKNPIVKTFFRWKFLRIIKIAELKKEDLILDFGCGDKWLKKILPTYNIIGYDINPKQTEIDDYRKLRPTKIWAVDVFEHISEEEIKRIIKDFKEMGEFELIVCIPSENWISKKIRKFVGKKEIPIDHITRYKQIKEILDKNLEFVKGSNFLTVSYFLIYKNKIIMTSSSP